MFAGKRWRRRRFGFSIWQDNPTALRKGPQLYNARMTPQAQLARLQTALQQLRDGSLTIAGFARLAQDQPSLHETLPRRFNEVLMQLLDRLESSALFSDESCSFSQRDLLDSLQLWLDKAQAQLEKT